MVDITHKSSSLRKAIARAEVVVGHRNTIEAIKENRVPKGNVLEAARVAGLFAVKKTSDMIPDCHPLPVEYTDVRYEIKEESISIVVEVWTIYRTGVEVEAMHGASVVALTIYDMLKPIDKGVSIQNIRLESKTGGKSGNKISGEGLKAAVIVCSDSLSKGEGTDRSGELALSILKDHGIENLSKTILPDDENRIREEVKNLSEKTDVVILSGGTGMSPRDVTPEAITPLLDRRLAGMEESIRSYGQERFPKAMFSRSVVGSIGNCLLIALPGSPSGVKDGLTAILPQAFHFFKVRDENFRH